MTLVLASRSPQRRAILEQLGVAFEVVVPDGVEELIEGPPHELVAENAYRKAAAVAAQRPDAVVLGVDTEVVIGARVYGKPGSLQGARAMLTELAGRRHTVLSGVCVFAGGRQNTGVASTVVEFRALDEALLDWYLTTDEWRERAGGYAIQGRGAAFVERIEGDYFNVVGLPVPTLLDLLPSLLPD